MKILPASLLIALLLATAYPAAAQSRIGIAARIFQKDHGGAVDVLLVDRRGETLTGRMAEGQASVLFEASQITGIQFELPENTFRQAAALAASGRGPEAVTRLRPIVRPLLPYLDLPIGRVGQAVLLYGRLVRGEKNWTEAIHVYRALADNPDDALRSEAAAWLAYCTVRNLQPEAAATLLEGPTPEDPRDAGFGPYALASAWHHNLAARHDPALDHAARAAALLPIGHELHPEALWLAAESYRQLGANLAAMTNQPAAARGVVLSRANTLPPPPSPMTAEEFTAVASNVYTRLARLFPSAETGVAARKQLDLMYPPAQHDAVSSARATPSGDKKP